MRLKKEVISSLRLKLTYLGSLIVRFEIAQISPPFYIVFIIYDNVCTSVFQRTKMSQFCWMLFVAVSLMVLTYAGASQDISPYHYWTPAEYTYNQLTTSHRRQSASSRQALANLVALLSSPLSSLAAAFLGVSSIGGFNDKKRRIHTGNHVRRISHISGLF